jgi:Mg2+ and Co2+ transporter CorA
LRQSSNGASYSLEPLRTLLTITGKTASTETEDVQRCFAEAEKSGLWLDIEAPDQDDYRLLEQTFNFHPLTIEDIQHQNQRPKIDEYPTTTSASSSRRFGIETTSPCASTIFTSARTT